jgi:DNA helicase TIP49 (TBP-interacting protein)
MNKVSLTDLDLNEVNLLIAGLMELPAKVSMPLYSKIKSQVDAQMGKVNENGDALPWNKE